MPHYQSLQSPEVVITAVSNIEDDITLNIVLSIFLIVYIINKNLTTTKKVEDDSTLLHVQPSRMLCDSQKRPQAKDY